MAHYSGDNIVFSRGLVKEPKPLAFPYRSADAAGKVVLPEDQSAEKEAPVQERKSDLEEAVQPREEPPEQIL